MNALVVQQGNAYTLQNEKYDKTETLAELTEKTVPPPAKF